MHNTIFRKSIFTYLIAALLCFLGTAVISYRIDWNRYLTQTADDMYLQATSIAQTYGNQYYTSNETLENTTAQLANVASLSQTRIMIISPQNAIIIDTDLTSNDIFTTIPDFDPAASGNKKYTIGNFYGIFREDVVTVTVPIIYNLVVRGYVSVHKPLKTVQSRLNTTFDTNYYTMLICLCMMLLLLFAIYNNVERPLRSISAAVDEYAKGNLSYRIKKYRNDEIGRLAASLNYMAGRLDELEQSERTFVANVSHDFRSPLTSIRGYLQAILDGTIPPDKQEKYLNIVITETERLTKLTNNILSLNNMDARKTHLNLSSFDIAARIKQTLDTFEGICKNKGIKFELEFDEQKIPVIADIDKMTQVLYNLIDNAIKFSHHNSTIRISVSERGERAYVSIKDTGIGIPKDSIDKIWERFYKTDLSRGKDKKGTGLGLAIVKEIINAHKENIDVISTQGAGTEFIFSIKRDIPDTL